MAALHDLLPPLLSAAREDLSAPGRTLARQDLAGVAVLLGLAAELLVRPQRQPTTDADMVELRADATASLAAVRRVTKRGGGQR